MEDQNSERNCPQIPLSALRLLVPPIRLLSAAMWETIQQKVVAEYGVLEEFVSMVIDTVPELLTPRQGAQLILGLRARLILDLCQPKDNVDWKLIEPHLHRMGMLIKAWLIEAEAADMEGSPLEFVDLVRNLLKSPDKREHFFQNVFPQDFGPSYDEELTSLMLVFLSRLEKMLRLPTFQQVASMFGDASSVLEMCMDSVSQCGELKALLQCQRPPSQLDHNDDSLERGCIFTALKLPSAEIKPDKTDKAPLQGKIVDNDDNFDIDSHMAPVSNSDANSWSYYSEDDNEALSSSSNADGSWSNYSGNESESPVKNKADDNSLSDCSISDSSPSRMKSRSAISKKQRRSNIQAGTPKKTSKTQCFICQEEFNTSLRIHMKVHFPTGDYACPQCDARFNLLPSLKRHLKRTCFEYGLQQVDPRKQDNPFKCDVCEEAFKYKISLCKHKRTHNELYCGVCKKVLRDAATLARHKASHTPFQCNRCDKVFTLFKPLLRHCQNIHKMVRPFKCSFCPKTFSKLRVLISHEWKHTGHLPFQCAKCSMRFRTDADLVCHERVHSKEKPYLCAECGKAFSHKSNLLRHFNFLHSKSRNEKVHTCSKCNATFKEKGNLIKHQRRKHSKELFHHPCPDCGKMVSLSTMARHKLIHTGERPFKCTVPECDKYFRSATEVKRHVLTKHSTERPFKCDICSKGFVKKCDLNTHSKVHSGEKPFVCSICGKAFSRLYSMQRHKKRVHASVKQ